MSVKIKHKNILKILLLSTLLILVTGSSYLIYNIFLLNGIENIIRYGAVSLIIIIDIVFIMLSIKMDSNKIIKMLSFMFFMIIFTILFLFGGYYINKAYSSISNINKNEVTYETGLVVLSSSNINSIDDLKNKKIGIIKDIKSIEGYVISKEMITENNIKEENLVEYDDFLSMLNELYEENVDAIFISSSYASMFSSIEHFEKIEEETKVLITKEKTMAKQENTSTNLGPKVTDPFTMLIMGIDSAKDDIKSSTSFNGDSLVLITFNPKTLNATMLSIPRDTFVPIMCFKNQIQNKITHAAWYGESCMIKTIENFTGIKIDYYTKMNFKGVVKLVDALGGVEVDVPYSLCEQNSSRNWGKNTVYVKEGIQTLNGEQALALSRNRKPNSDRCSTEWTKGSRSDFVRGQNQQLVIKAIANKLKDIRDINKIYEILDLIEKNMDTNLSTNQILSFYNIGKNILAQTKTDKNILSFEKLYLSTYGVYIYDEGMKRELSNQIYYKGSLTDVVDAMKVNLGLKEPVVIKSFTFSVNEIYEEKVIGKSYYNESKIPLIPDFTKYTKTSATTWGNNNNFPIEFTTYESNESQYIDGQIINQSIPRNSLLSTINKTKGITLTIIKKITPQIVEKIDCTIIENKDNSTCIIPDFVDKKITDLQAWQSKITSSSILIIKKATTTETESNNNKIFFQTSDVIGKSIYDLSEPRSMVIEYYEYENPDDSLNPTFPN